MNESGSARRSWTPAEDATLRSMWIAGKPVAEIAARLQDRTPKAIYERACQGLNLRHFRRQRGEGQSPCWLATEAALRKRGAMTVAELATRLNLSYNHVRETLQDHQKRGDCVVTGYRPGPTGRPQQVWALAGT